MINYRQLAKPAMLGLAILVPVSCYLIFFPDLKEDIDKEKLASFGEAPEFSLYNPLLEDTITDADLEGIIYVADFFFASCPSICPILTGQLQRVQAQYSDQRDFRILSHSIDPERDTPEALREYASDHNILPTRWHLLIGDKEQIDYLTEFGYKLRENFRDESDFDWQHSGKFILVDAFGMIRGYYDGTDEASVDQLILDVLKLVKEKDDALEDANS